jgi:hypothetical protein
MKAKKKRSLKFETEWLREYASTYVPSEAGFEFSSDLLRRSGISLVELRNALRSCVVLFADKLDGPGAFWVAEGPDDEEDRIVVELTVVSETYEVRLRDARRMRVESIVTEEGSDDAA